MSTRAVYTFKDNDSTVHVYKHCDGYPKGAAVNIAAALPWAWQLPRFEADEFAAAFVAGCKTDPKINGGKKPGDKYGGGDLRLLPSGSIYEIAPGDIAYRYEITERAGEVYVRAYEMTVEWWDEPRQDHETTIYDGPLSGLAACQDEAAA